eukprot:2362192-Rhodomonas_salina.2
MHTSAIVATAATPLRHDVAGIPISLCNGPVTDGHWSQARGALIEGRREDCKGASRKSSSDCHSCWSLVEVGMDRGSEGPPNKKQATEGKKEETPESVVPSTTETSEQAGEEAETSPRNISSDGEDSFGHDVACIAWPVRLTSGRPENKSPSSSPVLLDDVRGYSEDGEGLRVEHISEDECAFLYQVSSCTSQRSD